MRKSFCYLLVIVFVLLMVPTAFAANDWRDEVFYFLLVDKFNDGDKTINYDYIGPTTSTSYQGGDLQGIIDKLNYFKGLGITALWISPVVANDGSFASYHGYWPVDFYKVDKHFGDGAKLKELVKKAHANGIKIFLDIVINHTGPNHPWINDPKYKEWFHAQVDIQTDDQTEVENGWLAGLPDLNTENPEVRKYLIDMSKWWIKEYGVDGFRLDTVKHVPHEFWQEYFKEIKHDFPKFFALGEILNFGTDYVASYQRDGLDAPLDFPMFDTIRSVFGHEGSMTFIAERWQADSVYPNPNYLATFIDNHDFSRFIRDAMDTIKSDEEALLDEEEDSDQAGDKQLTEEEEEAQYQAQLAAEKKDNERRYLIAKDRLHLALAFLMTNRGIPIIYYGTETAMNGLDNRTPLNWGENQDFVNYTKKLVAIRKANPALRRGTTKVLLSTDPVLAFLRQYEKNSVVTVLNNDPKDQTVTVPVSLKNGAKLQDALTGEKIVVKDGKIVTTIKSKGAKIYVLQAK